LDVADYRTSSLIAELDLYIITYNNPLTSADQFEEKCNQVKWYDPGEMYTVLFTSEEIRVPTEDCQISYSDLCEPRFYSASTQNDRDGERYRRNILRLKTDAGGLIYLYTSAQDQLNKGLLSSELTEATPPTFPTDLKEYLQTELPDKAIGQAPEHILTEFVRDLDSEYWVSGISKESADLNISGRADTTSTGVEIGAITRSKAQSEISLSGKSNKNRQRRFMSVFMIHPDRLIIDGYYGKFYIRAEDIQHIGDSGVLNIVTENFKFEIKNLNGELSCSELKEYLADHMDSNTTDKNTGTKIDSEEKIRQLHQLMEDGIISEDEFDEKKRELLDDF
jgi:hypothetical protein